MTKPVRAQRISNRIAHRRKELNITALALAEKLGVRETTIFRWQAGAQEPSIRMMHKLARALGCTLDDLFPIELEEASA